MYIEVLAMSVQTINISLPIDLVKQIDIAARSEFASRSDYIRQALVGKLRSEEARGLAASWLELEALSEEIASNAEKRGLVNDEDFVRLVKEVRRERSAQKL